MARMETAARQRFARLDSDKGSVPGVRSSRVPGSDRIAAPEGAARRISYGDRIVVRLVNVQRAWETVAEFVMTKANDMSDVYGELRHRTSGQSGLGRLYVRNVTRGWNFEQPFKLYGPESFHAAGRGRMFGATPVPASSLTHPVLQPARRETQPSLFGFRQPGTRAIPASVKTYDL